MARALHRLKVKSGGRTIASGEITVDPADHGDLRDAVHAVLKQARRDGAKNLTVEIYKGSRYMREETIR